MGSASHDSERVQKKRKTREEVVAAEPEPEVAPPTKKRKRRAVVEDEQTDLTTQDATISADGPEDDAAIIPAPRKEKRKKDRHAKQPLPEEVAPAPSITSPQVEQASGKRGKYPDPSTDGSLSEQAQKSLIYAYQYATKQPFKFNKGRQNWLMRNYCSNQVPEEYVKTVLKYLKSAQGQAVVHMRQTCEGILAQGDDAAEAEAPAAEVTTETGLDAPKVETMNLKERRRRAKKLLKVLPPTN